MLAAVVGFIALSTLVRSKTPSKGYYDYVASRFATPHSLYPMGESPNYVIDGAMDPGGNLKQRGNPDRRNPFNALMTYPNEKDSRLINKTAPNWREITTHVLNKDRQMDFIDAKIGRDDHYYLSPEYKQSRGSTVSHMPKFMSKPGVIC